jgi:cysteine desulfurase / selenocysteine lyase
MLLKSSSLKEHFPQLNQKVNGYPYLYLDTAATSLKPQKVIDAISNFYAYDCATVHRALYSKSEEATHLYNSVREKVCDHIGASSSKEIIFTKGTTDSINLLAKLMDQRVGPEDAILISEIEHHSNIIPWQLLSKRSGCQLKTIRVDDSGNLDLSLLEELLKEGNVSLISLAHISNITGGVHPLQKVSFLAKQYGAMLSVDGAQAVAHLPVDVQQLGADFYHFSGHKIYGPTGIGVFYGREALLNMFDPVDGGGDMVSYCDLTHFQPQPLPLKFEAGTPHIAGVVGLGAALDFLKDHPIHLGEEQKFLKAALESIEGIRLVGAPESQSSIFTFVCEKAHPMDVAFLLNAKGIALRSGHLCSQPALQRFGYTSFLRVSLGVYNDKSDIARFKEALISTLKMMYSQIG